MSFENEINIKSKNDLFKINENQYNVLIYNNYCDPFILYDNINFFYNWKYKSKNELYFHNEKLSKFILDTAKLFENIAEDDFVIELEKITQHQSCQLFHEDYIKLRLLVTLCGIGGTQYTSNSNIDYNHLMKPWNSVEEQNNKLIKDWKLVKTSNVGDLLVLKGKKKQNAVLHRSFPLESDIDYRYILKMTVR